MVSIHAPARGATGFVEGIRKNLDSFNSRAREGRDEASPLVVMPILFQFTRPRGARHDGVVVARPPLVSIHAPARGATPWESRWSAQRGFNSRAREGRDDWRRTGIPISMSFNSRAREGRDTSPPRNSPSILGFNSRAREGRDQPGDFS